MGRPTDYNEDITSVICGRLVTPESLRSICRDDDMPALATVFKWLARHPEFVEQYTRAREEQAEALADEIVEIADEEVTMIRADKHNSRVDDEDEGTTEVVFDSAAVARNRLRVDARKWVAAKLKPKKYGDRQVIEHEVSETLSDRLRAARERTSEG